MEDRAFPLSAIFYLPSSNELCSWLDRPPGDDAGYGKIHYWCRHDLQFVVARSAGERHYLELAGAKVAPLAEVREAKAIIAPATGKPKFATGYPGPREAWL
jgi:hypothetical protein